MVIFFLQVETSLVNGFSSFLYISMRFFFSLCDSTTSEKCGKGSEFFSIKWDNQRGD